MNRSRKLEKIEDTGNGVAKVVGHGTRATSGKIGLKSP